MPNTTHTKLLAIVEMTVVRWHTRRAVDGGHDTPVGADRSWIRRETLHDLKHPSRWLTFTDLVALGVCAFIGVGAATNGYPGIAVAGLLGGILTLMLIIAGHASRMKATLKHVPADPDCWEYVLHLRQMNPLLWNREHIDAVAAPALHIGMLRLGKARMGQLFSQRYAHVLSDPTLFIRLADAYDTVDMVAGPAAANHFFALCLADPILLVDPAPVAWTLASLSDQDSFNLALHSFGFNTDDLLAEINANNPADDA